MARLFSFRLKTDIDQKLDKIMAKFDLASKTEAIEKAVQTFTLPEEPTGTATETQEMKDNICQHIEGTELKEGTFYIQCSKTKALVKDTACPCSLAAPLKAKP